MSELLNGVDIENDIKVDDSVSDSGISALGKKRGRKPGYKRSQEEIAKMVATRKKNKIIMSEPNGLENL
jgi:hypothetical protein